MGGDGVTVDPGALVDYSEQLTAISENALGAIEKYTDNLEISDDLQVALIIMMPTTPTWATLDIQKDNSEKLAKYVGDLMSKLGGKLHEAARNYKKSEGEGSAKILQAWGESVPDDYEEEPHRKGDTKWDGSDLKLDVPHWKKRAPEALDVIEGAFNYEAAGVKVTDVVNYIVGFWEPGFDVMKWLKEVIPDWGELDGLGAKHGELQKAYQKIRTEVEDGMNYVGSHWDGAAAAAFEYHVRKHWLDGLETLADLHRTLKEGFQAIASLIDAAIWLWVEAFCGWIKELRRIVTELKDNFLAALDNGPQALWDLGKSLWDLLKNLLDLVLKVGEALIDFLKTVASAIDLAAEIFGGSLSGMAKT